VSLVHIYANIKHIELKEVTMTSDPNNDPGNRMRNLLSDKEGAAPKQDESLMARLPRKKQPTPTAPEAAPVPIQPPVPQRIKRTRTERIFQAFWTVTGVMSLVVNGILLAAIIYLLSTIASLQLTATGTGASVLAGFYSNFEKMDRASIVSSIPVDAQIPLNITVPIQKTTMIRLASDATITNAHVRINTGTLNIDAPAQVTLPAGTTLEVALDFEIPVQNAVPVHLDVPVNIPLAQTQLHEPFSGLQDVVRPFLCLLQPNVLGVDGLPVCH